MGLRVSPVFQNNHLEKVIQRMSWQAIQDSDSFKALQSYVVFSMYLHIRLGYSRVRKKQA